MTPNGFNALLPYKPYNPDYTKQRSVIHLARDIADQESIIPDYMINDYPMEWIPEVLEESLSGSLMAC